MKIDNILRLLYSENVYDISTLIRLISPKDNIELIECYTLISAATNLRHSIEENDLIFIEHMKTKNQNKYLNFEPELRGRAIEGFMLEAQLELTKFNFNFGNIRGAYKKNPNSVNGITYKDSISKGRPLSKIEREQVMEKCRNFNSKLNPER